MRELDIENVSNRDLSKFINERGSVNDVLKIKPIKLRKIKYFCKVDLKNKEEIFFDSWFIMEDCRDYYWAICKTHMKRWYGEKVVSEVITELKLIDF